MTNLNSVSANYRAVGLSVIPLAEKKRPLGKWLDAQKQITEYDFTEAKGIGLVCGVVSGGIEAIDFDLKYDLTGDLMTRYKTLVESECPGLVKRMTVQKTPSGGFHFVYRCSEISGNLKLARRRATPEEEALGQKVNVLIETRGEGGYIACAPTEGYEMIWGTLMNVNTITAEEREVLHTCAGSFNEYFVEQVEIKRKDAPKNSIASPIDDFNERGDVLGILTKNGWSIVKQTGSKIHLRRPGQTSALTSGNYDEDKKWFSVFTTSSQFEPEKAYNPSAVFCKLECGDNWTECARRLYDLGYGERGEGNMGANGLGTGIVVQEKPKKDYSGLDFVAKRADYEGYLKSVKDGTLEIGKTTGVLTLDKHFLLKKSQVNIVNGYDNVGKTLVLWYLALLSAMLHGWKWGVLSIENSVGGFHRRMSELYWGCSYQSMNEPQIQKALSFLEEHFFYIKNEEIYNYEDVIGMSKELKHKHGILGFLIDPYNGLSQPDAANGHRHDYKALSEMRLIARQEEITFFVNTHSVTSTYRSKDEKGRRVAPNKGDTEGGTKFASKADDFLTIHRHIDDPDSYRVTELFVRKVKEVETGGRPTMRDQPITLELVDQVRFVDSSGRDAVREFHGIKGSSVQVVPSVIKPNKSFFREDYKEEWEK